MIIAFAFLYFVMVRPQKRRQLQTQRMLNDLKVGDEIVTAGGLYGEVTTLGEAEVTVRIASRSTKHFATPSLRRTWRSTPSSKLKSLSLRTR